MPEPNQPPQEVYVSLTSTINDQLVQKLVNSVSIAINNNIKIVHLFMYSPGGSVPAAVTIYNFLTNIPINLIVYNGGYIASAAAIIYLSGKVRKASPNATFLLHEITFSNTAPMTVEFMKTHIQSIERDGAIIENILRRNTSISDSQIKTLQTSDLIIGAEEAKSINLVHEIGDFVLPPGNQLYNIEMHVSPS
jgi:ATP-dependent Clp protease, protease subunit